MLLLLDVIYAYIHNRYDGDWKYDLKHGIGRYSYSNGDRYEGEWADDTKHGQVQLIFYFAFLS